MAQFAVNSLRKFWTGQACALQIVSSAIAAPNCSELGTSVNRFGPLARGAEFEVSAVRKNCANVSVRMGCSLASSSETDGRSVTPTSSLFPLGQLATDVAAAAGKRAE
jgi:hypothetical protein